MSEKPSRLVSYSHDCSVAGLESRRVRHDGAHARPCAVPIRVVVSDVPDPLEPLNVLRGALTVAHEAIYDLHRRMVSFDRATPISRSLLEESARIVLQSVPAANASAQRLAAKWHEQSALDPQAAQQTALQLEEEVAAAEFALRDLLARESAIAAELTTLLADSG